MHTSRVTRRPAWLPRRGFTLVELIITLAVFVVLLAMAVPGMTEFNANTQLATTKSSFTSAVALARTEAGKRGQPVFLQALGTGPTGNEFANGWEVAVDSNGDGSIGTGELRVRKSATTLEKIQLSGSASLGFRASGALVGTTAQVYTLCRVGGSRGYSVTVTPSGGTDVAAITTCS